MYEKQESVTASRLGRLLAERAEETGTEMPCTQAAMDVYSSSAGGDIDYLDIMDLDNVSFSQAVYFLCFNVPPIEMFIEQWKNDAAELDREEFQKKFINSFVHRSDFGPFHVRLQNCFILDEKRYTAPKMPKPKTRLKARIYNKLWPTYMHLPMGVRRVLKKLLRKRFFMEERG